MVDWQRAKVVSGDLAHSSVDTGILRCRLYEGAAV